MQTIHLKNSWARKLYGVKIFAGVFQWLSHDMQKPYFLWIFLSHSLSEILFAVPQKFPAIQVQFVQILFRIWKHCNFNAAQLRLIVAECTHSVISMYNIGGPLKSLKGLVLEWRAVSLMAWQNRLVKKTAGKKPEKVRGEGTTIYRIGLLHQIVTCVINLSQIIP